MKESTVKGDENWQHVMTPRNDDNDEIRAQEVVAVDTEVESNDENNQGMQMESIVVNEVNI